MSVGQGITTAIAEILRRNAPGPDWKALAEQRLREQKRAEAPAVVVLDLVRKYSDQ